MGVSVLIPTRGRPKRFRKAVESLLRTKAGKVEVLAYLDDDDPGLNVYREKDYPEVRFVVGPRLGLAKIIHHLIGLSLYSHILLGADDIEFKTPQWDLKLVEAMPTDGIGIVFCEDNWKQTCNHFMFHQKWYSLTGLFPDDFEHFGPDGYVLTVAKELKRDFFVKDVVIEHHHVKNGRAPSDRTYEEARENNIIDRDQKRLKNYAGQIQKDVETLRAYV